jgi:acyl-CoA thioester hydrolase
MASRSSQADPELVRNPEGRTVNRTQMRVRYAETDRMGIAYNAHYLTWFEVGRTEFMRAAGLPYREVEERGHNLPLVEVALRLRISVRYDDVVTIETRVEQIRSRTVTFAYRILAGGKVVADGRTVHACVRASDSRVTSLPPWLQGKIAPLVP